MSTASNSSGDDTTSVQPSRLTLSLVICTKDRPDDLGRALQTVWRQSRLPDQLVIIDDGHLEVEPLAAAARKHNVPFVYHNKSDTPGLLRSRFAGLRQSSGDVILFLDDDVLLDDRHIEALMEVHESDAEGRVGGCCGVATGYHYHPLQMLLLRLFGMDDPRREGQVLKNFLGVLVRSVQHPIEVQWLSGSDMSYRREALASVEIPPTLLDCFVGEDRAISYPVGLGWRLIATPAARFEHRRVGLGRDSALWGFEEVYSNYQWFRRYMPQDVRHRLAFAWLCVGYVVINLLRLHWRRGAANVRGIVYVLLGKTKPSPTAKQQ